jgi:hypothetical protein
MSLSADAIKNKILSAKGNFVKVCWKSQPKPAASFKNVILEKVSEGVVRAGIDYANLSSVKQGIEEGTRGEVGALPWGQWKQFPYIIEHKGVDYIRLYPSVGNRTKTHYYVDGSEVSKEQFASYLTGSDAKKLMGEVEEVKECFNVKAENILGIPTDVE